MKKESRGPKKKEKSSHALRKVSILETFFRGKSNIKKAGDANSRHNIFAIKINSVVLAH